MKNVSGLALLAAVFTAGAIAVAASPKTEPPIIRTIKEELEPQVVRVAAKVDGKSVRWWAHRARRNGNRMRHLQRSLRAQVRLGSSGLERAFLCIHSYEGAWTDSGAPFWGGLQMDYSFQRSYGGEFLRAWGTANNWPPAVQITVAIRAYISGRGFRPWPNTARYCGLIG